MQKKILISVDSSRYSKSAVQYAAKVASVVPQLHCVLFNVQPMISLFLQDEARKNLKTKMELEKLRNANKASALKLLEAHRKEMIKIGISDSRIELATRPRKLGLAKDILEYSQENSFDAIVVGRRGLSRLQEMISDSVSADLVEHSRVVPVWLVDGDVADNRILAAVDGSESSLRVIDHLSFMLSGNPDTRLNLLHVNGKASNTCEINLDDDPDGALEEIIIRGKKACIDQFYAHALEKLKGNGISEDHVDITTVDAGNIGKVILETVQKDNYGTLVIGRRGINKAFFTGSVSRYIISKASNQALWIVP